MFDGRNTLYSSSNNYNSNYNNNLNNNYNHENDTEQEAIYMIKTQNKKIQDLYNEIDRKDQEILEYQKHLTSNENTKLQVENFKRQCEILEEKLNLYDSESTKKTAFLNEQLKQVSN